MDIVRKGRGKKPGRCILDGIPVNAPACARKNTYTEYCCKDHEEKRCDLVGKDKKEHQVDKTDNDQ